MIGDSYGTAHPTDQPTASFTADSLGLQDTRNSRLHEDSCNERELGASTKPNDAGSRFKLHSYFLLPIWAAALIMSLLPVVVPVFWTFKSEYGDPSRSGWRVCVLMNCSKCEDIDCASSNMTFLHIHARPVTFKADASTMKVSYELRPYGLMSAHRVSNSSSTQPRALRLGHGMKLVLTLGTVQRNYTDGSVLQRSDSPVSTYQINGLINYPLDTYHAQDTITAYMEIEATRPSDPTSANALLTSRLSSRDASRNAQALNGPRSGQRVHTRKKSGGGVRDEQRSDTKEQGAQPGVPRPTTTLNNRKTEEPDSNGRQGSIGNHGSNGNQGSDGNQDGNVTSSIPLLQSSSGLIESSNVDQGSDAGRGSNVTSGIVPQSSSGSNQSSDAHQGSDAEQGSHGRGSKITNSSITVIFQSSGTTNQSSSTANEGSSAGSSENDATYRSRDAVNQVSKATKHSSNATSQSSGATNLSSEPRQELSALNTEREQQSIQQQHGRLDSHQVQQSREPFILDSEQGKEQEGVEGGDEDEAVTTVRTPVAVLFRWHNTLPQFHLRTTLGYEFEPFLFTDPAAKRTAIRVDINTISRSVTIKLCSFLVIALMWLLSAAMLVTALDHVYFRPRTVAPPVVSIAVAMLFALPNVRNVQPDIPAVGIAVDVAGFFWNMVMAGTSVLILLSGLVGFYSPDSK